MRSYGYRVSIKTHKAERVKSQLALVDNICCRVPVLLNIVGFDNKPGAARFLDVAQKS
jgi:hypothetical protein